MMQCTSKRLSEHRGEVKARRVFMDTTEILCEGHYEEWTLYLAHRLYLMVEQKEEKVIYIK